MLPSAAELVARFLKSNGYSETLNAFIKEAGLARDAGSASKEQVTIEQILQEKKTFDLSVNFEKLGVEDTERRWLTPAPSKPTIIDSFPKSNVLSVHVLKLILPSDLEPKQYLAATTADRRIHLIDAGLSSFPLVQSYSNFLDSPVLDLLVIESKYLLVASMSGRLLLYDSLAAKILDERKHHSKYLVKLASWSDGVNTIIATAGWDAKVLLYRLNFSNNPYLGEPIASINLPTIPETLLFTRDTLGPILLLARRDSTFLHYYSVSLARQNESMDTVITFLGRQNLAPYSNAWVAFTPSDLQICPVDASLVAVATSSTPHMKLLVLKLLMPSREILASEDMDRGQITQTSQSRAELLIQDREEAAILVNVSTMAPQTAYSTPRLAWRPDGSGIYVTSDDGIVRGFEVSTGKLQANLEAHELGFKLRCLWTGRISPASNDDREVHGDKEILISGGFDQRLVLWDSL